MVWTNPITWVLGQVLTAAQMNEQLRDNLQYLYDNRMIGVPGLIHDFGGSVAPTGYLMCDGSAVSRTTYAALFQAIGTTWGVGDNSSTFNLPDLRGRVTIGAGQGSGLTNRALAGSGGEENHTLTGAETGAHTHAITDPNHSHGTNNASHSHTHGGSLVNTTYATGGSGSVQMHLQSGAQGTSADTTGLSVSAGSTGITGTGSAGSGTAHNVMQPYRVVNKIIKT